MTDPSDPLIKGLRPVTSRVRRDKTAKKVADGTSRWTREPLTDALLAVHCNGGPARGVCPIAEGSDVTLLAVLDFDSHRGDVSWAVMSEVVGRVADEIELVWGMSPVLFRSSGGHGVHLYLLWDAPQDCYSVRAWLGEVLVGCGLRVGTGGVGLGEVEAFPKQNEVKVGGSGSQFILPLAGASVPLVLGVGGEEDLW